MGPNKIPAFGAESKAALSTALVALHGFVPHMVLFPLLSVATAGQVLGLSWGHFRVGSKTLESFTSHQPQRAGYHTQMADMTASGHFIFG
jgi:hypothetical protein